MPGRPILLLAIAVLNRLGFVTHAHADHPTIAFGSEAAGPIAYKGEGVSIIPSVPFSLFRRNHSPGAKSNSI